MDFRRVKRFCDYLYQFIVGTDVLVRAGRVCAYESDFYVCAYFFGVGMFGAVLCVRVSVWCGVAGFGARRLRLLAESVLTAALCLYLPNICAGLGRRTTVPNPGSGSRARGGVNKTD